jgi:hypothetical protein
LAAKPNGPEKKAERSGLGARRRYGSGWPSGFEAKTNVSLGSLHRMFSFILFGNQRVKGKATPFTEATRNEPSSGGVRKLAKFKI